METTGAAARKLAAQIGISVTRARRALVIGVDREAAWYSMLHPNTKHKTPCNHEFVWASHEERQCRKCGHVVFVPDW